MAIKTGTITARPTNKVYATYYYNDINKFLAGTGDMYVSPTSTPRAAIFNGFNFSELNNLNNVTITGLSVNSVYKLRENLSSAEYKIQLATGLTQNSSSYTDLGDGSITIALKEDEGLSTETYSTKTISDLPNSLNWINNNLSSFINGAFGVRFYMTRFYIKEFTVTITYTYEEANNQIYIGTAQPSKIYVGTQEVKEVYVGTTKVYG